MCLILSTRSAQLLGGLEEQEQEEHEEMKPHSSDL